MARGALTLRDAARSLVFRTGNVPGLRAAYLAVYRIQIERARRALGSIAGIDAVLLRGSNPDTLHPGLSDVDLVVLPRRGLTGEERLVLAETVFARLARVNRGAPLVRDVHVVTHDTLLALVRMGSGFAAVALHDSVPIVGEEPGAGAALGPARETLFRELAYWTAQTLRHADGTGEVAAALSARSFAKALAARAELESGEGDLRRLVDAYARKDLSPASASDALALLREGDRFLPDAEEVPPEPRRPDPNLSRALPEIRRTFAEAARDPSIESVVLSFEGAREADARAFVVVDPSHPRAPEAVTRVLRAARERPLPRELFSRFFGPIVVTRRGFERSVFLRWTATEPVARRRHAETPYGPEVAPRATLAEMKRALALEVCTAAVRVHELVTRTGSSRSRAELADVVWGLVPAARALARHGEIVTRYSSEAPATRSGRDALLRSSRELRREVIEALEVSVAEDVPRLLEGGAP